MAWQKTKYCRRFCVVYLKTHKEKIHAEDLINFKTYKFELPIIKQIPIVLIKIIIIFILN